MKNQNDTIVLAHGGGGELTKKLIEQRIVPKLTNDLLSPLADSALINLPAERICFTTDSYVVQPIQFPGGDIGNLAVAGTVNDLAVCGALPKVISLALIIEEGLPIATFDRIIDSIAATARQANVFIATGDTKVIESQNGKFQMAVNTAGIGILPDKLSLDPSSIAPGDIVIITGNLAEHGLAVMSARQSLAFKTSILSDVAPLNHLIESILHTDAQVKFMRDPTRSGLAGVLADLTESSHLTIEIDEEKLPITPVVQHTAEMLGLDPLTIANEGKCVLVVAEKDTEKVILACRKHPLAQNAALIGRFTDAQPPLAELITRTGGRRIIQRPYGQELPRIC